jgi:RNA-binding protein
VAAEPRAPELTERQKRYLRGLAHPLKPVIRTGNAGLTAALVRETARALQDHELIKVKAAGADRSARDALIGALAQKSGSALVHRIGNVAVLYRPRAPLPKILIPDAGSVPGGALFELHPEDLVGARTTRGGDVHDLALGLADQRAGDR